MKRVEIRGVVLLAAVMVWGCASERGGVIQSGDLASRIEASLDALSAKTSFYAKHLPSGREIAIRADEPMNALSVIKIPVMVLAYRDADAGTLDLDERYRIQPEDMRRGSGLLQSFAPGIEPTYRDIITQMIITSDNTATDVVINRLGLGRVNTMLEELGFEQTRLRATTGELFRAVLELADSSSASLSDREVFESGFPSDPEAAVRSFGFEGDSTQWLGRITAREVSHILEAIEEGELASPESSNEMIGILRRQFYSSRLPQQLRGRASIAHKTGDWPPHAGNDVGILYYEGGPTVVAVFTNQNQGDFFELEAALGRIAVDLVDSWH
ncbi:MAG TPA: serine hydrolase [Gemmatimonadetes bacterium]|nr:serine hydrolase [Gemmatimonadota bacterium]HIL91069.1 serine hydrolase [Gemmatimonadota bacterium]